MNPTYSMRGDAIVISNWPQKDVVLDEQNLRQSIENIKSNRSAYANDDAYFQDLSNHEAALKFMLLAKAKASKMDRYDFRIKRLNARPKITLKELAKASGLSFGTHVALETCGDDYDPGVSTIRKASAAMTKLLEARDE